MSPTADAAFARDFLRRLHAAANAHDPDALAALCTEDVASQDPAAPHALHGRDAVRAFHRDVMFAALPDAQCVRVLGACAIGLSPGAGSTHPGQGGHREGPASGSVVLAVRRRLREPAGPARDAALAGRVVVVARPGLALLAMTVFALRAGLQVEPVLSAAWVTLAVAGLGLSWWFFRHCRGLAPL